MSAVVADGDGEVVLVLDDYHLVDSGPVHESVAFLLENLPPGLRVVVSGRADPPLPLARLRRSLSSGDIRDDYKWLPDTAANLSLLTPAGAIPAGFTQVPNVGAGN